ncbi:hypothetical protein AYY22_15685 [Photobacterium kishitanii]|nr:hypothetical protein AYY22_15685 [Photobacterium kishitanii]
MIGDAYVIVDVDNIAITAHVFFIAIHDYVHMMCVAILFIAYGKVKSINRIIFTIFFGNYNYYQEGI